MQPRAWSVTDDALTFAAVGDNGSGGRKAVEVAEAMALSYETEPYGCVSLLGDICYYGAISRRFEDVFLRPLAPLVKAGVQFELAVGNHDGPLFLEEGVPDVEATLRELGTPTRVACRSSTSSTWSWSAWSSAPRTRWSSSTGCGRSSERWTSAWTPSSLRSMPSSSSRC